MNFDEYQEFTNETAIYGESAELMVTGVRPEITERWLRLAYVGGKLNGEAGEIAELIFKAMRDDVGVITVDRRSDLVKEIGDALYYLARLAIELDSTLGLIAESNMEKLRARKEQGKIKGSGSDR
jgi:NTP pyrophosphatase (non-canonical NTP hydrolase)